MKSHHLVSLQYRTPKCEIHPQCNLDKVCLQDKTLICSDCLFASHNGHTAQKLEEVASSIRTNLAKKVDGVTRMGTVLNGHEKDVIQHAQDAVASVDASILEVDRQFEILYAKLASRQQEMKDEIRAAGQIQIDEPKEYSNKVSQIRSEISSMCEDFTSKSSNDFDLVTASSNLELQLKVLEKDIHEMIEERSPCIHEIKFIISTTSSFENQISSWGIIQKVPLGTQVEKQSNNLNNRAEEDSHITPVTSPVTSPDTEVYDLSSPSATDQGTDTQKTEALSEEMVSTLNLACVEGDDEKVKVLVALGSSTHYDKALILAVDNGHDKCLDLLIKAGADKNASDKESYSALIASAQGGYEKCLTLLLDAEANKNAKTKWGDTALIVAAANSRSNCVELLIKAGVERDIQNKEGGTALMMASCSGDIACVELLLEAGVNHNAKNKDGNSALVLAAEKGYSRCVELLIAAGPTEPFRKRALVIARRKKHSSCVQLLEGIQSEGDGSDANMELTTKTKQDDIAKGGEEFFPKKVVKKRTNNTEKSTPKNIKKKKP